MTRLHGMIWWEVMTRWYEVTRGLVILWWDEMTCWQVMTQWHEMTEWLVATKCHETTPDHSIFIRRHSSVKVFGYNWWRSCPKIWSTGCTMGSLMRHAALNNKTPRILERELVPDGTGSDFGRSRPPKKEPPGRKKWPNISKNVMKNELKKRLSIEVVWSIELWRISSDRVRTSSQKHWNPRVKTCFVRGLAKSSSVQAKWKIDALAPKSRWVEHKIVPITPQQQESRTHSSLTLYWVA